MSSNYEWQKQLAAQRIEARRQEAEDHRRAKKASGRAPFPLPVKLVIPALLGAFVALWLLTACTAADGRTVYAETTAALETSLPMADRIRFQDKLESRLDVGSLPTTHAAGLSMADRIHFQDERQRHPGGEMDWGQLPAWTMADKIRFHDRLWEDRGS